MQVFIVIERLEHEAADAVMGVFSTKEKAEAAAAKLKAAGRYDWEHYVVRAFEMDEEA